MQAAVMEKEVNIVLQICQVFSLSVFITGDS